MKKILITQRLIENDSYFEVRDCLDINWGKLLKKLNYLPIILPTNTNFKDYFDQFKIDGIILTGGNDLYKISKKSIDLKRDNLEKEIIKYAIEKNIPLLGVCRGMQIIAYLFKETICETENHVAKNHLINLNKDSTYNKNKKLNKKEVNSYHNYGFKKISENFLIVAKSQDGVIEAIEHKKNKIYGVMWHPERNNKFDQDDLNFFKEIFK
jgi:N5-(cytidine 5'-diphosphoramidyl)-L-glutamine hydrolase